MANQSDLNTIYNSIWQDGRTDQSLFKITTTSALLHTVNNLMNEEEQIAKSEPALTWYIYIICCKDKSLYTGITTDLTRRIDEHNSAKKGARYTRSRRPVELVYFEKAVSRAIATRREAQIKKLTPAGKKQLIKTTPPLRLSSTAQKTGC